MIKLIEVDGVSANSAALPVIQRTPEGEAMGAIPQWNTLIDPLYIGIPSDITPERTALDRAAGVMMEATRSQSPHIPYVSDMLMQCIDGTYLQMRGEVDINPNEWTVFATIRPVVENRPRNFIVLSDPANSTDGISLSISYSAQTGDIVVYEYDTNESGQPQRLLVNAGLTDTQKTSLVMVTFSTTHGLKVFVDGVLLGAAPDDKRPLTRGYSAGQYNYFRLFRGAFGMSGSLNLDLGAPVNTSYRRAIERFLMTKYGIS
ncbi:MAG: hypothetical protein ACTID3_08690 [Halomonas sp.]|uniref:hypothetical protein n=1 Tax=Halomonas sp. TaxID=1486246 RepID=UPI003F8F3C76